MNSSNNSTIQFHGSRKPFQFKPGYHYTTIIISISIILVNSLVISLFRLRRSLYKTASNHLLLSLAITDLLTGLNTFLQMVPYFEFHYFSTIRSLRVEYLIPLSMLTTLLSFVSVLHLCSLSTERYISIFYALSYRSIVTKGKVDKLIIVMWSSQFSITAIQIIWLHKILSGKATKKDLEQIRSVEVIYSAIVTSLFSFIPTIGMGVVYCKLYFASKGIIRKVPDCAMNTKRKRRKEERVLVTYSTMYACFLLLSAPYFTVRFIADIDKDLRILKDIPIHLMEAFYMMRTVVSLVNPVIYTLLKRDFRKSAKSVIRGFLYSHLRKGAQQKYKNCFKMQNGHNLNTTTNDSKPEYYDSGNIASDRKESQNLAEDTI